MPTWLPLTFKEGMSLKILSEDGSSRYPTWSPLTMQLDGLTAAASGDSPGFPLGLSKTMPSGKGRGALLPTRPQAQVPHMVSTYSTGGAWGREAH